jgi:surfeit locus 1 family protein
VEGVLSAPGGPGWMQPDNEPGNNRWFWVDIPAMAEAAGLPAAMPLVLQAAPGQHAGDYPVGGRTRVDIPNNHLQYAITWFGLAAALLGIYVLYHLRRPGDDGRAPSAAGR